MVARGSNPGPCIFYALFLPTELSSRELILGDLIPYLDIIYFAIKKKKKKLMQYAAHKSI